MGRPRKWIIHVDSCSGCYEFNEGLGQHRYRIDPKHGIRLGHGCSECGYTGKRRHYYSVEAMAEQQGMTVKEFLALLNEED